MASSSGRITLLLKSLTRLQPVPKSRLSLQVPSTCFKVWLESKRSVYPLCFWLCTTSGLCKLEVNKGGSHPKTEQCVWGERQVTEVSMAAGTPPGTDAQKCRRSARVKLFLQMYTLPFPKGTLLALLGVAGHDQWFSLQCNWLRFSSKNISGFGPVFSTHETPGTRIRVFGTVFIWSQAGERLLLAVVWGKSPLGSSLLVWKPKYTIFKRPLYHFRSSELCKVPSDAFGAGKPESQFAPKPESTMLIQRLGFFFSI